MPAVALESLRKAWPGVLAVDDVSLDVEAGEIHAIVGENGAGKTTLMRLLGGLTAPDSGRIRIGGREVRFRSALEAGRAGIGMVHQHFTLVPVFTVLENISLGREPRRLGDLREKIAQAAERIGFAVEPDAVVADLSVGEKQRVEILRHLIHGARVLILDEPTDVLTPVEANDLFRVLRELAGEGRTILFISHRLPEVLAASDRVTVMRRGKKVGTVVTAGTSERELARMMVGRDVLGGAANGGGREPGAVRLSVEDLTADSDRATPAVRGVSFEVRGGEVTAIAGVSGNGQRELFEAILGLRPGGGRVAVDGRDLSGLSVRDRLAAGLAYVPEDRLECGLVPSMSAEENLELGRRGAAGFRLPRPAMRRRAEEAIAGFDVNPPDPSAPASAFSGGNQQKIVLARALGGGPAALLLAEPTRGLDVGAIENVYGKIRAARDAGAAVVVTSSDVAELLALADRILVMARGKIAGEVVPGTTTEEELGLLMSGGGE
ncbi:MAG: ABC transporter ATP-binding protein [Planctomycetota bacterium]